MTSCGSCRATPFECGIEWFPMVFTYPYPKLTCWLRPTLPHCRRLREFASWPTFLEVLLAGAITAPHFLCVCVFFHWFESAHIHATRRRHLRHWYFINIYIYTHIILCIIICMNMHTKHAWWVDMGVGQADNNNGVLCSSYKMFHAGHTCVCVPRMFVCILHAQTHEVCGTRLHTAHTADTHMQHACWVWLRSNMLVLDPF